VRILVVTVLLTAALVWSIHELPAALHTVSGDSMLPTVKSGQVVVVNRFAYLASKPAIGDVLVFRYPGSRRLMVKRVFQIIEGPRYIMVGDNQGESFDSRHFGSLDLDSIVGRVEFLGSP
jgi:nickel-type superoxide dismutase maturation protease